MATFTLNSSIYIGAYKMKGGVNNVKISKSIRTPVDRAVITLPSRIAMKLSDADSKYSGQGGWKDTEVCVFKRGDPVRILLGYNGSLVREFNGFVSRIHKTIPMEIECEGYSMVLHSKPVNGRFFKNTTLKDILLWITADTPIVLDEDIPLVKISVCQFRAGNALDALKTLQNALGNVIFVWFEGVHMFASMSYLSFTGKQKEGKPDVVYKVGFNTIWDLQMKERLAGDSPVEVTLHYKDKSGKTETVKAGISIGRQEVKRLQAIEDLDSRKTIAQALADRYNYEGLDGKLITFLQPYCRPGFKAQLIDGRYAERNGNYLIESVEVTYGRNGARRSIELSKKL